MTDSHLTKKQLELLVRLVNAYYEEKISYGDFLSKVPAKDNPDVQSLLYAIEHQPGKRGFFGANNTEWHEKYKTDVFKELDELLSKYNTDEGKET